jgi:hypothetical protein
MYEALQYLQQQQQQQQQQSPVGMPKSAYLPEKHLAGHNQGWICLNARQASISEFGALGKVTLRCGGCNRLLAAHVPESHR